VPIVLLTLTASCTTWKEEDKDAWHTACMETAVKWAENEGQATEYCNCVLDKLKKKYPSENDALEHIDELSADTSLSNCKRDILKKQ
jgi:hypothetical protein